MKWSAARPLRLVMAITLVALTAASPATAAPCQEHRLEAVTSDHPECRFYKGTRHYRQNDYAAAWREWLAVADAKDIPKDLAHLRLSAQNNLGYLYYTGLGVQQDAEVAIQRYWLPAEQAGHEEAAYHLCHAYADRDRKIALEYCREALRRYGRLGEVDDNNQVVAQLRRYISRLKLK